MLDYSKIDNVEVEGIDLRDYPDFCDAYIVAFTIDGREATDNELEELNQDSTYVHEATLAHLF